MSARPAPSAAHGAGDRTRERAAAINQLLMGAVTLVAFGVVSLTGVVADENRSIAALVLVFVVTGLTIATPWNRLPPTTLMVVPLLDVVAVGLMESSSPGMGFSLLWVLPCLWLSSSFGIRGFVVSVVVVSGAFWTTALLSSTTFRPTLVLLPVAMIVISAVAYLTARRARAQRRLLRKQGESLKHAVDRAQRQEIVLSEILDAVDFGVVRFDADGTAAMANEAHTRLLTLPARAGDDGKPSVYGPDGITPLTREDEPIARAARGETFESTLAWYGAPGTSRRALSFTARALRGADGAAVGGLVVFQDVTSEVMALRAREDLIASVSHELRTPLTSILGYVDLALDSPELPDASRSSLEVVERNAERLLQIVADLLAASADARGGIALTFHPEHTDLAALVHAAVDAIVTQARSRAITIDTTGVEQVTAWTDPLRMRQVVDNLLSNAVKYHRDGGGLIEVGVTADIDHAWLVVRDDGPGIRAEEVPLLFDRFYRADAVRHTSTHGSGLGLAISLDIMRAQGGDITVRTEEGTGSTFIVRIPVRPAEE